MDARVRPERSKVLKILGIATLLLVAGASWLAISTARYMKGILRNQFNEQQLVLARHAAQRVEAHINNAIDDLLVLIPFPQFSTVIVTATKPCCSRRSRFSTGAALSQFAG